VGSGGVLIGVFWSFNKKLTVKFNEVRVWSANRDKNETIRGRLQF